MPLGAHKARVRKMAARSRKPLMLPGDLMPHGHLNLSAICLSVEALRTARADTAIVFASNGFYPREASRPA